MEGYLREANDGDVDLLFEWVNDSVTRQNSFDSHNISYEEHVNWFQKIKESEGIHQYIYVRNGNPVGQVRVEVNNHVAKLGYSIAPGYRMMGYGKEMIFLAKNLICSKYKDVIQITAHVKLENVGSKKVLLDSGFVEAYETLLYQVDSTNRLGMFNRENVRSGGRALCLTNNSNALPLFEWLGERAEVEIFSDRIQMTDLQMFSPTIIVSYNYNYIIGNEVIEFMRGNIINLHISLLPWNRGSSPNIWSFLDDTPKGVTIHKIDCNLDKGKILYQEEVEFDTSIETIESSYNKLNDRIVELFKRHWCDIIMQSYKEIEPVGKGSYHSKKDLKRLQSFMDFSWTDTVDDVIAAYKEIKDYV